MSSITYGVFSNNLFKDKDLILEIKSFIGSNHNYSDFVVFSDATDNSAYSELAILVCFYIKFFTGKIIFLKLEDYYDNKDHILAQPILYLESEHIENIDRNAIRGCDILIRSPQHHLTLINNHELQQAI